MFLQSSSRWFCISVTFLFPPLCRFFRPRFSPLVVALESLRHEQLPEVLRGEFLHVLAVVVNLPCWRVATCNHAPPHKNTNTHPQTYTCIHLYTDMHTNRRRREREGEGERENSSTAKHQISEERSKRKDQNVVRRRGRDEQRETAGKGAVESEIESINFKLM